jgi:hypothetical protein
MNWRQKGSFGETTKARLSFTESELMPDGSFMIYENGSIPNMR